MCPLNAEAECAFDSKKSTNLKYFLGDLPGGPVVKNSPYNARDVGSIPG